MHQNILMLATFKPNLTNSIYCNHHLLEYFKANKCCQPLDDVNNTSPEKIDDNHPESAIVNAFITQAGSLRLLVIVA